MSSLEAKGWPPGTDERIRRIVDAAPRIEPNSSQAHTIALLLWPPTPPVRVQPMGRAA